MTDLFKKITLGDTILMRVLRLSVLAFAFLLLLASVQFAQKKPNYNCTKVGSDCVANCDKTADKTKNAKAYDKCLADCDRKEAECNKRQDVTSGCADTFQGCVKNAKSEKDKEVCRAAYRKCKGE
jgi:hypothetical protein